MRGGGKKRGPHWYNELYMRLPVRSWGGENVQVLRTTGGRRHDTATGRGAENFSRKKLLKDSKGGGVIRGEGRQRNLTSKSQQILKREE